MTKSMEPSLQKSKEDLAKEIKVLQAQIASLEEEKKANKIISEEKKQAQEELKLLISLMSSIYESPDLESAIQIVLERLCNLTGWDLGQCWIPSTDGSYLHCNKSYYCSNKNLAPFREFCESYKFEMYSGMPGRVWNIKLALWEKDISKNAESPRKEIAIKTGVKAQFCFPVKVGDEVIAILEFFMSEQKEEDKHLISLVSGVAYELSGFIWKKKAEEANMHLSYIVEHAEDAILSLSLDGLITSWNQGARDMYGYEASEVIGKPYTTLMPSGKYGDVESIIQRISNGKIVERFTSVRKKKDGTSMFVSLNASPIKNSKGEIIGISKISHEIIEDRFSRKR